MSFLLFVDESGHDHNNMPYEVRGGVALHATRLWGFVQAMRRLEESTFGDLLHRYRKQEVKGHSLLDRDRFRWAAQGDRLDDEARRAHSRAFLLKGIERQAPTRVEFTAYGQACLEMARGIFQLLRDFEAVVFATVIPRGAPGPDARQEYLRKDYVFLLERYFYFLEHARDSGLLVLDRTDNALDRRFVEQMERYFQATRTGRLRASRIVPAPFFVASEMTYPIQAADVCIYCINWGFRLPGRGMTEPTRPEVEAEFGPWLRMLQFQGEERREGSQFLTYGITYVPDPYSGRAGQGQ
ncbi:MAG TPA: DUF3800 domain-containing protein [Longimicrobium sp.]|nr:DUF3800 domain-containing protein [Longimicrobium sp.]